MKLPTSHKREKKTSYLTSHREDIIVSCIWVVSLIPAFMVSVFKNDPLYASFITILIQFLASFGSITLFGVITQLFCYRWVDSSEVHDRMMDGLFYGFHAGMIIWILFAFFSILFVKRTIGEINALIGLSGIICIISCFVGILCGFIVGNVIDSRRSSKGF